MKDIKLQYFAPVQDPTGLGYAAREIESVLSHKQDDKDKRPWVFFRKSIPIHPGGGGKKICKNPENYNITGDGDRLAIDADITIVFAPPHMLWSKAQENWNQKSKLIGYTMWETDDLLPDIKNDLCNFDCILVPSWENFKLFKKIIPNTYYFPLPIHNPGAREVKKQDGEVKFCSCFEWSDRKGAKDLINAFNIAFDKGEASLTIKSKGITQQEFAKQVEASRASVKTEKTPSITLLTEEFSLEKMDSFYRSHDCFVLLTRGEGWCYPAIDAYTRGLYTIMTERCGVSEFLKDRRDFVTVPAVTSPVIGMPNFKYMNAHQNWFIPSMEKAVSSMRRAYEIKKYLGGTPEPLDKIYEEFGLQNLHSKAHGIIKSL